MRVIKMGQDPAEKLYRATCQYCYTEVEFALKEVKVTHDQRDGDFMTYTCPCCTKLVYKSCD